MSSMASPEMGLERGELATPESFIRMHPARYQPQRRRIELVEDLPPLALSPDQARLPENLQVLGDGGKRHVEILGQLHDRLLPLGEGVQNLPAGRIGDGTEYRVHARIIVKRLLKSQIEL